LPPACDDASDPADDEPEVIEPDESAQPGTEDAEPLDPPEPRPGLRARRHRRRLRQRRQGVRRPVQLLQAIALRREPVADGRGPGGVRRLGAGLRRPWRCAANVSEAASLLDVDEDADVMTAPPTNIRAARGPALDKPPTSGEHRPHELGAWAPAVAELARHHRQ
jgi:hypothetical protein